MTKIFKLEELQNTKKETKTKELKPVELKFYVSFNDTNDIKLTNPSLEPSDFDTVTLIETEFCGMLDLIFCKDNWGVGLLYLGHWNDGIVKDEYEDVV